MKTLDRLSFQTDVIDCSGVCVVEFMASWCEPCKELNPILHELEQKFIGKIQYFSIDVDESPDIAIKYDIQGVPTIIVFVNGIQVGASVSGVRRYEDYELLLDMLLEKYVSVNVVNVVEMDYEEEIDVIDVKVGDVSDFDFSVQQDDSSSMKQDIPLEKTPEFLGGIIDVIGEKDLNNYLVNFPNKKIVIVFTAVRCSSCKSLQPELEKFEADYRDQVVVLKIDSDLEGNSSLLSKYDVMSLPQISIVDSGVEINRLLGAKTFEELVNNLT